LEKKEKSGSKEDIPGNENGNFKSDLIDKKNIENFEKFENSSNSDKNDKNEELHDTGNEKEGWLFKQKSSTNVWRKYFFRFYADQLLLCYFKTKEDAIKKKFQGKINIGWMWTETISEEDGLVKKQLKSTTNVCTQRFTLFTPKRIYVLSAETDEICTEWTKDVQTAIDKFTLGEEREEKIEASKELEPLLNKILKIQMDQVEMMLNALKESGLFITDSSKKLKEGHLDIKKQDDTWKTYYVVLWKDCLSYFDAESKSNARGFISTESIISLKSEEFKFPTNTSKLDQKQKEKIEEEKKRNKKIQTCNAT